MASREEILADFQACTGIEDVGIAIAHLEGANWALVDAVNKVMPSNSPPVVVAPSPVPSFSSAINFSQGSGGIGIANDDGGGGRSNQLSPTRDITTSAAPFSPVSMLHEVMRNASSTSTSSISASIDNNMPNSNSRSVQSGVSIADDFLPTAGASGVVPYGSSRTRMLEFNVQYAIADRIIHLKVPDNEDVKTLKTLLQGETGFAPCQQELTGFRSGGSPIYHVSDRRRLSELNLPKENVLYLNTPVLEENTDDDQAEPMDQEEDFKITLIVTKDDTSQVHTGTGPSTTKNTYQLNFRPTDTVHNVKFNVSNVTDIAVSRQKWVGWPEGISDDLSLAQIGIPKQHELYLSILSRPQPTASGRDMPPLDADILPSASSTSGPSTSKWRPQYNSSLSQNSNHFSSNKRKTSSGKGEDADDDIEEVNESDDNFDDTPEIMMEPDDSDIFMTGTGGNSDITSSRRPLPLLPDDYGDETMAAIKFSEEFIGRYGRPHPAFFPGSLEDAIKESCMQPAKDRKILAVYLHHDASVFTNVFCSTCLCADSVVSFLNENFVCFGWDLSFHSNKNRAVNMITKHFGSVAAANVKTLEIERLPLIALIYRLRGTTEIFQMIEGSVSLDELMSRLLSAHDTYQSQLVLEIREEEERASRDAVKREQDLAFEMSLVADREKEAAKKREEEERREQEKIEAAIRHSEELERERKEREKQRIRSKIMSKLPQEPKDEKDEGQPVSKLRFRVPVKAHDDDMDQGETDKKASGRANGIVAGASSSSTGGKQQLERRFLASSPLQTLLDYLTAEGYPSSEFKVLSSYPRRDLTTLDASQTLKALKLYPQETLILEEK